MLNTSRFAFNLVEGKTSENNTYNIFVEIIEDKGEHILVNDHTNQQILTLNRQEIVRSFSLPEHCKHSDVEKIHITPFISTILKKGIDFLKELDENIIYYITESNILYMLRKSKINGLIQELKDLGYNVEIKKTI